jgi:hypothetical protein
VRIRRRCSDVRRCAVRCSGLTWRARDYALVLWADRLEHATARYTTGSCRCHRRRWRAHPCRLMISECAVVVGNHAAIGPLTGSLFNRAAAGGRVQNGHLFLVRGERSRGTGHLTRRSSEVEGVCDERWSDVVTQRSNQSR